MSPNTAMKAQRLRRLSIFCPVQSSFEISLSKSSSGQAGGVHFGQPLSVRSRMLLTSDSTPYHTALFITEHIQGRNNTQCLSVKKKINNLDQYPLPNTPYMVCGYIKRTTVVTSNYSNFISYNFIFCPICLKFSYKIRTYCTYCFILCVKKKSQKYAKIG